MQKVKKVEILLVSNRCLGFYFSVGLGVLSGDKTVQCVCGQQLLLTSRDAAALGHSEHLLTFDSFITC